VTSLLTRTGSGRPSLSQLPGMSEETPHKRRPAKLLAMIVLSAIGGLLLAVMALPIVGGIGVTAKASADFFNDLPSSLTTPPLPERSVVLDRNGNQIATLHGPEDRVTVPFSDIPVAMRHAIVAIEDRRFYEHHGIDYRGIIRAAFTNQESGEVTQGGSTLTQQYVKNVLLESATNPAEVKAARERSVQRKIREARYALALERKYSKDQILANYLNIANFGDGAYGVEAASQHYFGIHAKQLNIVQSALLAGIVNSPAAYDPKLHPKAALARRQLVLEQMAVSKYITPAQLRFGKTFPLGLTKTYVRESDGCESAGSAAYFCSYVRNTLLDDPKFGATAEARQRRLFEGGLTIKTSLDPTIQAQAQNAVDTLVPAGGRIATADVVMQPGTGEVLAMAINRKYADTTDHLPVYGVVNGKTVASADQFDTKFNFATQGAYQAGSTFKMFTLAAALEKGLSTATSFLSPGCIYLANFGDNPLYPGQCASDTPGVISPYGEGYTNSDPAEAGVYNMAAATGSSVNTYFVQLEKKVGLQPVRDMAVRLGVQSHSLDDMSKIGGSLTLGAKEVSPLDMATGYATIAAHGLRCYPKPVVSMTGSNGKAIPYAGAGPCKQVLAPGIADTVTSLLENVIINGTGSNNGQIGRPAAGKTGTTDHHYDAWFVGYIPQLVTAVWLGDARSPSLYPMEYSSTTPDGTIIGGIQNGSVFGGDMPTRVWAQTMKAASVNLPLEDFPPPDQQVITGITSPVPSVGGLDVGSASAALASAGFTPISGGTVFSPLPPGTVAYTAPAGGSTASQGSGVTIFTSGGPEPPPPTVAPTKKPTTKPTKAPVAKPTTKAAGGAAAGGGAATGGTAGTKTGTKP
jgi:membrane peptidoglycan carboxypeptidase